MLSVVNVTDEGLSVTRPMKVCITVTWNISQCYDSSTMSVWNLYDAQTKVR